MKGKERVCNVTEADRPRGAAVSAYPKKCLHVRLLRVRVLPLCAAVLCGIPIVMNERDAGDQAQVRASGGCLGTERR